MAFLKIRKGSSWEEAYEEAKELSIILTRRQNKQGAFMCYKLKKETSINEQTTTMQEENEIKFKTIVARLEKAIQYDVGMHGLNTLLYGAHRKGIVNLTTLRSRYNRLGYKFLTKKELKDFSEYAGYDLTKD